MSKVDHPSHYNVEGKKECIVQMEEDFGPYITAVFCLTNAYKYLYRAGNKDGESEADDIAKAEWYFEYACNLKIPEINHNQENYMKLLSLHDCIVKELEKHEQK